MAIIAQCRHYRKALSVAGRWPTGMNAWRFHSWVGLWCGLMFHDIPGIEGWNPLRKKNETLYSLQEDLAVSWCWLLILPRNTGTFLSWDLGRYLKESHERTRQILDVNPRLISIRKLIWAADGITIWWESPNSNPFYDFVTIVIRQHQKNAMCNFEYLIISLTFIEYQTG